MVSMRPESLYEIHTDDVDLDSPVLLHALSGFLDAGAARQLAVNYLLDTHEHRTVGTFDIDCLYDYRGRRPSMVFDTDHYEALQYPELLISEIRDKRGTGFLLVHGPEPDFAWRAFTEAVVQIVERFGVRRSIGLNSIPWPAPHSRPVGVTAHATDSSLVAGRPTFVGMIVVPGHLSGGIELALGASGHEAMGFAAHVPHYLTQVEFPAGALALLKEIAVAGDLDLDLDALEVTAETSNREIDEQISGNPENAEAVQALEAQYDAIVRGAESALPMADDGTLPSGDELAAHFEQFLREMDEDKGRTDQ
ncbi:MAG: PAC2 family protein [Actinobacteria bacterium]|nr:PAC2 family protein [Actinomycetota bacterium]MSW37704.1 PAC2 family protein [Actinomycetota bacterium]